MISNPTVGEALMRFKETLNKAQALSYASSILFWDASTGAPKSGADARSNAVGTVSGYSYELFINTQMDEDLNLLMSNLDALEPMDQVMVKDARRDYDKLTKIPQETYQKFNSLISKSAMVWEEAKEKSDFQLFKPYLEQVVDYLLAFAEYRGYEGHPYNLYLDDFETGMTIEQLDVFFDALRARIVPFLKKIKESTKAIDDQFLKASYPLVLQEQLSVDLLKQMGFDTTRGWFKESVHPFTMGVDIDDVRLTTHYYENDVASALLSTAHEGGHAIYEQNISREYQGTPLASGTSSGIHESQSRIYENNFVKSEAFISHLYPKMREMFPEQLQNVSLQAFYEGINKVQPSLIRVEADEMTYALHIMIRYEIELGLIDGTIKVENLPKVWNEKVKSYLGIDTPDDAHGVLQDVHWSEALFGYFPTYALGSAYAAQLSHYMEREIDVDACLREGNFEPLTRWLNEKIHTHGSFLKPNELMERVTGERLNPQYYCDYLEKKYSAIYELD